MFKVLNISILKMKILTLAWVLIAFSLKSVQNLFLQERLVMPLPMFYLHENNRTSAFLKSVCFSIESKISNILQKYVKLSSEVPKSLIRLLGKVLFKRFSFCWVQNLEMVSNDESNGNSGKGFKKNDWNWILEVINFFR